MILPGDLCFDVGANIGDYTDALTSLGARVVAIEPQPACIDELRVRFRHNDHVTIVPIALGAAEGAGELFLRQHTGSSGFLEVWDNRENVDSVKVPIKTLDQMIASFGKPKYIKIDVEGYELQVAMGLTSKVELISFEYRLSSDDCAAKLQIIEHLKRFGILRLAILGEGASTWTKTWSDLNDFLATFPNAVPNTAFLGDIFVQII
jgi:FkbM family methyltransferase